MQSHQGTLWAVRKARPSDLFTHNLRMLAIFENGRNLILLMFLPAPRCPHTGLAFKEGTALGITHILRPRMVFLLEERSLFSLQCDRIPASPLCLELQYGTGKCLPRGNLNPSVNCPKNFESYREDQVMTPAL